MTTHSVVTTISTSQTNNGTGAVQSIGMSPNNAEVLAVLTGLGFPGDVMATINPSTQAITATVGLQNGTDLMGQLVSDGSLGLRLGSRRDERERHHPKPEPRRL